MPSSHDVIAIGSGHNGLVAAAYLAAAGKSVLVLERNPFFGGGVVTRELTVPGFLHDQHSMAHIFILANPLIKNDELGLLSKYGLRYLYPEVPFISVFPDGETLAIHRDRAKTRAEIAKYSQRDADAFMRLSETAGTYLAMLLSTLYSPPAPLGATYAMLDQSPEGRALLAIMHKSCYDVITEMFEHERVLIHFMRLVGENLTGPEEKGTGLGLFLFLGFIEQYGIGCPVGGSGALTDALIRLIEDHGGTVMADTDVAKILIEDGRAVGIRTVEGEEFKAGEAVIGAIHPHLLDRFIDGIEPRVAAEARATKLSENCCITLHAALENPLDFYAGPHVNEGYIIELVPDRLDTMRRFFDQLRYGRIPDNSLIGLGSPSTFDPGRVPAGKATVHAWDYVPYEHPDGGASHWDAARQAHVEKMLQQMAPYIRNMTHENIIAYHSDSPLDMERTSPSFRRGDIHGIAANLYQFGAHRPMPDLGQNTVPGLDRFYLVGPFQHPGGGVFGAGRAAAIRIFDDLGLDFDKVAARG